MAQGKAANMTSQADFNPPVGSPLMLAPNLHCIVAPNASPMTWRGTNTYLLGQSSLAIIDPGPDMPAHFDAIIKAATGRKIEAILLTHSHVDHSPLARRLSDATQAPVLAYGNSKAGQSKIMQELLAAGMTGGGEGIDKGFEPDQCLKDGEIIHGSDWSIQALWTPGHMGNHMCFAWDDVLFSGDHVMGWASSLVSPPDGDLTQFMASCKRLLTRDERIYHAGHGAPITEPKKRLEWLISHRLMRKKQILGALKGELLDLRQLTNLIYTDTPPALLGAAERNVLAHLIDLAGRGLICWGEKLTQNSIFRLR